MKLKELKNKLLELKENLKNETNEGNYCNLTNLLIDFDNEDNNEYYMYDRLLEYYELVPDDELLQDVVMYQLREYGLSRLRCFLGSTSDDDIYLVDAYGNLENVNDEKFEEIIDFLVDEINLELDK